ncbi:MAG: methylated-DNA--[protein]-cysteine S-methyltransferase [Oscillospiraceae bacterium]
MSGCIFTETPVGLLRLASDGTSLTAISPCPFPTGEVFRDEITIAAERQLNEYFTKKRKSFDIPIYMNGTDFQLSIWRALMEIPYGETVSYGTLSAMTGNPKAFRAAGNACGKNPLMIIVPCHRVISSDGKIGGFSADINIKKYLLDFEN